MENLYRICLLNTEWTPPVEYMDEPAYSGFDGRNTVTGY